MSLKAIGKDAYVSTENPKLTFLEVGDDFLGYGIFSAEINPSNGAPPVTHTTQQTLPLLSELLPQPLSAPVISDLEGTWQELGDESTAGRFRFSRQGDLVIGVDAKLNSPAFGQRVVTFPYPGQKRFAMKLEKAEADAGLRDLDAEIVDPDKLLINRHSFYRVSDPKLNDLPCDANNRFNVTASGAISRAAVAEKAEQASTAFCWAMIAGKMGNANGEFVVGRYLRTGFGVEQNPARALAWMLASAKQGYLGAQWALGEMFAHGEGTPPDIDEALSWYKKAEITYAAQHPGAVIDDFDLHAHDDSGDSASHQRTCVVGASPGPNPHAHIQTYCRTN